MVMNRIGVDGAEGARTASVLNIIAGIWLIISPFWMGFWTGPAPLWNTLVVGVVVGLLALVRACYPTQNVGLSWVNLILGIWLIVSPFFLPYQNWMVAVRNDVIVGIVVGVLAIWSALATPVFTRYAR
jgi:hypothetical protein